LALSRQADPDLILLRLRLAVPVLSAVFLFSCGANTSSHQISVKVPGGFTGVLLIRPCMPDAAAGTTSANDKGFASTAACPRIGDPFTVVIDRAGTLYRVSSDAAKSHYTGDGFPVSIEITIPPKE
jgi:hypothetical protein